MTDKTDKKINLNNLKIDLVKQDAFHKFNKNQNNYNRNNNTLNNNIINHNVNNDVNHSVNNSVNSIMPNNPKSLLKTNFTFMQTIANQNLENEKIKIEAEKYSIKVANDSNVENNSISELEKKDVDLLIKKPLLGNVSDRMKQMMDGKYNIPIAQTNTPNKTNIPITPNKANNFVKNVSNINRFTGNNSHSNNKSSDSRGNFFRPKVQTSHINTNTNTNSYTRSPISNNFRNNNTTNSYSNHNTNSHDNKKSFTFIKKKTSKNNTKNPSKFSDSSYNIKSVVASANDDVVNIANIPVYESEIDEILGREINVKPAELNTFYPINKERKKRMSQNENYFAVKDKIVYTVKIYDDSISLLSFARQMNCTIKDLIRTFII